MQASTAFRWHHILGVLIVLGLAAEAGARLTILRFTGDSFSSLEAYRWSPYGLVRNNPELTSQAFKINNAGFRSRRPAERRKKPNTFRVMVLGGSVAYAGLGRVTLPDEPRVTSDQTVAQYLEEALKRDPALRGKNVEVLNAAVNFNRIPEVATAYLTEWRFWDADLVLVMGSANNFGYGMPQGSIDRREYGIQLPHPWRHEFDVLANSTSLAAFGARVMRSLSQYSAALALTRKYLSQTLDQALVESRGLRPVSAKVDKPPITYEPFENYDAYVDEYLGYAAAMIAAGHSSNQKLVFFWEYFIAHLGGIRPFNERERFLYTRNKVFVAPVDKSYDFHARDRVRAKVEAEGALFVDPLDVLRTDTSTIFIDYLHYTANGNRVMAERTYRSIREWVTQRVSGTRG